MAMLVSLTSFAAALGEGYEKVTDISTLAAGDKVVLYCDDAELGVTGWDGTKTATVATEGWVEYVVEPADGGVLLKDGEQYIALTAKNGFYYTATGSICKVTADGLLCITLAADGKDYMLYENSNNGSPLYRMYVDKSTDNRYKPVYVYEVVTAEPEPVMFTVTVAAENGTVEGDGEYEEGKEATLTATAAEGYEFVNWTVDGAEVSTENPYTFVVTANVALVANFKAVVIEEPLPEGVPTNAELWEVFKPYYNTYYSLARDLSHPVANVSTFANAKMQEIMTDAASEYKWLGDYVLGVAAAQGVNLPTDMAAANEGAWRWAVHAFFNAAAGQHGAAGTDFTEAGKPQAWGPAYLAAQKPAEPVMETVYFVNALNWTGTINAYAWTTDPNAAWPGAAATKEAEQIGGYDVYSYTAEAGLYENVIFNGTGGQTADLKWTADKYYVLDGWYTKEEAEAKLATPIVDEVVYFVNNQKWSKVNAYAWDPANAAWPGKAATKEAEQIGGFDVYSYSAAPGTYQKVIFNDGGSNQTADMVWTAGKYIVNNKWYTKEEAEAALAAPVVTTWTMVGDKTLFGTEWDLNNTANDLVKQEDGSWVLTLTNKTLAAKSYEYKAAKDRSWTTTVPGGNNAKLTISKAGQYDVTFTLNAAATSVTAKTTYIPAKYNVTVTAENGTVTGAGEYEEGKTATLTATAAEGYEFVNWTKGEEVVSTENPYSFVVTADVALVANFKAVEPEIEWIPMDLEITNLTTEVLEVEGAKYLQLMGRNDMMDADVMLFLNNYADVDDDYEVNAESSLMTFGGMEFTVIEGVMTQTSETDKGTIYTGTVYASVTDEEEGGTMYVKFALTMYAAPATVLELTDAIVAINEELGTLTFNVPTGEGEGYFVELAGYTAPGVHEGPQICLLETPEAVAYTNYAETSVADGVITLKGEFTSFMGAKFDLTISGKLPVVEPEKPEPTYTENNLNPFAFGLESELTEDGAVLNVAYRLNNSNATSVNVIVYNGDEVVATVPGTTEIGKNTLQIGTAELPAGVELTWAVEVNGTSVAAPTQETKIYSLYHPSAVDIDNNPENPTFGLILSNDAMQSVASTTGYISSGFGAGIFAFTPSFDPIMNGEKPGFNGGKTFSTVKNDFAPRRIRFSKDGRIFATAQDGSGEYLWEINPENLDEWTTVFQGTNDGYTLKDADGNFIAGTNAGFDVRGEGENLQLLMLSASLPGGQVAKFQCHTYDLGTATTWATAPTKEIPGANYMLVTNQSNVQFDKDGGVWYISYRGTTTEKEPGLVHINKDGVEDYKELRHMTRNAGFRFNHDFTKVIIAGNNGASKKATIYAISEDANGAPVLTQETVIDMSAVGANLNDFAWDYAGNLYACGNSSEKLAAWAMPYSGQVVTPAASKYAFQVESGPAGEYYEDVITNMQFDLENMVIIGGPSQNFQIDVYLVLGEDDGSGEFQLTEESSVAVMGQDAKFIEGIAYEIDAYAPAALVDLVVEWNGMLLQLHLTMSAAPMEATVVVVENAAIEIEEHLLFGDTYDYSLKMTGNWINEADGLTYPVLVEVPVYYPEATEPSTILSTVTVGGWGDEDPWLGFGEGELTVTTVGNTVTATGIVENPMAGIAIDITISGNLTPTGLENATVTVKPVKMIQNGQLIIQKGDAQYNAQGALVK